MAIKNWPITECPLMSLVDGVSDLWTRTPGTLEYSYTGEGAPLFPPSFIEIGGEIVYPQEVGSLDAGTWGWDGSTFHVRLPLKSLSDGGATDLWAPSGGGTDEYYYTGPEIAEPDALLIEGSEISKGTVGSLGEDEWGFGDNDGIGHSVPYIRLTSGEDPDTKAADFVQSLVDPDANADGYIKSPKPYTVVQKQAATECILLSLLISNYSDAKDARVWVYQASKEGDVYFPWFVDLPKDNSPFALDTKIVLNDEDRLVVMPSIKEVSVLVSGDEE
jgi:hypothetical protein